MARNYWQELAEYLGEHVEALERFSDAATHPKNAIMAIWGLYGPRGTDGSIWKGTLDADRPALLAKALDRYAGEGALYTGRYFRRFVEAAVQEHNDDRHGGTSPPSPRGEGGGKEGPARPATRGYDDGIER